jgi:hypothetical protein
MVIVADGGRGHLLAPLLLTLHTSSSSSALWDSNSRAGAVVLVFRDGLMLL